MGSKLNIFDQMKLRRSQLHPPETPLYGFGGKRVNALGKISLLVSFGDSTNARTEYITMNVIDIYYPYNAIFGRGFTNKFNTIIHSTYLFMKMPALRGVLTIFGNQKDSKEIETCLNRTKKCEYPPLKQRFTYCKF